MSKRESVKRNEAKGQASKEGFSGSLADQTGTALTQEEAYSERTGARLSVEDIQSILRHLKSIGLTWTPENPPALEVIDEDSTEEISAALSDLAKQYPTFYEELTAIMSYVLFGTAPASYIFTDAEDLERKATVIREHVLSPEFIDEYFFIHSVKVPIFKALDWEVVVKTAEKGVKKVPGNSYALVSLVLQYPSASSKEAEGITLAMDDKRVSALIQSLSDIQRSLGEGRQAADRLNQEPAGSAEKSNA